MTPSIPIFRNEINALEDFRGGLKVARDFAEMELEPDLRVLGNLECQRALADLQTM